MKKLIIPIAFLLLGFQNFIIAQSAEILDVRKKEFRGVHPIINKATGKAEGYYTFYVNEKIGGGKINFVIMIYDLELNVIKQTPVTMSKGSTVEASVYNGNDFFFIFRDLGRKQLSYVTIDSKGDIIKTKGIKENKWGEVEADVFPSTNGGFFLIKPIKDKKWGYTIERVDREINTKWLKQFVPERGYVFVEAIESRGDQIMVVQIAMETRMSKKAQGRLIAFDDKDGKEVFSYPLFDGTVTCIPSAFRIDDEKNIVTSGMYFEGEKWQGDNSDGIFFLRLSPEGKKMVYVKEDWNAGIQKVLKDNKNKGVLGTKPKVYFHEIIEKPNGYQVIGETFRTVVKAAGMMGGLAGTISNIKDRVTGSYIGDPDSQGEGASGSLGFNIEDFVIFDFNKEGVMTNMSIIKKDVVKVTVYQPYAGLGGLRLARIVDAHGFFGFAFTTELVDTKQQVLVSDNMTDKDPYIGVNTIEEGKVSETHKILIKRRTARMSSNKESDFVGVVKSKPGFICVYYYDKEVESVNLYLEQIKL